MGTYKTSDFRKGLKVQIDGEPYLMTEMNFVKPGKGNALYKCRLKNLIYMLKQIEAKWPILMGFFKQARLVEKFSPFLSLLGKH